MMIVISGLAVVFYLIRPVSPTLSFLLYIRACSQTLLFLHIVASSSLTSLNNLLYTRTPKISKYTVCFFWLLGLSGKDQVIGGNSITNESLPVQRGAPQALLRPALLWPGWACLTQKVQSP
jgi:hypothetical protein